MTIKNPGAPATDKQVFFLHTLQSERGLELSDPATLTKGTASALIEQVKATPKNGKAPAPAAPAPAPQAPLFVGTQPLTPTGPAQPTTDSALVGKLIAIPYADSAAVVRVVADDETNGLVYVVKAHGVNPDDWTHPLIGEGPTRIERDRAVALAK